MNFLRIVALISVGMYVPILIGCADAERNQQRAPIAGSSADESLDRSTAQEQTRSRIDENRPHDPESVESVYRAEVPLWDAPESAWIPDIHAALERATRERKPLLVFSNAVNCVNCRLMERRVLVEERVAQALQQYITVVLYVDAVPGDVYRVPVDSERHVRDAQENVEFHQRHLGEVLTPTFAVLEQDDDGNLLVLRKRVGLADATAFLEFLDPAAN